MCAKISVAVRELTPTYDGKAKLSVSEGSMSETSERWAKFGQEDNHGLVGLSPSGDVLFSVPGHEYGKEKVVEAIDGMLAK